MVADRVERLQKFMAGAGVASRRECEVLISQGAVSVNGQLVTELGTQIDPQRDHVTVAGRRVQAVSQHVYVAFNKPRGVVTTASDPQGRMTVLSFLKGIKERVYPVGRLDMDSQGLLLLTNDGDVAHALTHPSHMVAKTYLAEVHGRMAHDDIMQLRMGVDLEDGRTAPAKARLAGADGPFCIVEITIHEGRNRQVRRMCEALGHPVRGLVRTAFGPVSLGRLSEGKWRHLSPPEVSELKRLASLVKQQGQEGKASHGVHPRHSESSDSL